MKFCFLTRSRARSIATVLRDERATKLKGKRAFARMGCGEWGPTLRCSLAYRALRPCSSFAPRLGPHSTRNAPLAGFGIASRSFLIRIGISAPVNLFCSIDGLGLLQLI